MTSTVISERESLCVTWKFMDAIIEFKPGRSQRFQTAVADLLASSDSAA